jgi:hypothetical protein
MQTALRVLASLCLMACVVAGCGGDGGGGAGGSGGGIGGIGGAGGGGSGGASGADMAMETKNDMGLLLLAQPCTSNAQCASNLCAPYAMGTKMLCSFMCTKGMPAPMCTAPGDGTCNGMGYCKFPNMN